MTAKQKLTGAGAVLLLAGATTLLLVQPPSPPVVWSKSATPNRFEIIKLVGPPNVAVTFTTRSGELYALQKSLGNGWANVPEQVLTGAGDVGTLKDTNQNAHAFYRIAQAAPLSPDVALGASAPSVDGTGWGWCNGFFSHWSGIPRSTDGWLTFYRPADGASVAYRQNVQWWFTQTAQSATGETVHIFYLAYDALTCGCKTLRFGLTNGVPALQSVEYKVLNTALDYNQHIAPLAALTLRSGELVLAGVYWPSFPTWLDYYFWRRATNGTWSGPLVVQVDDYSSQITSQNAAMVESPNGEVLFFRKMDSDHAIGRVTINAANGLQFVSATNCFVSDREPVDPNPFGPEGELPTARARTDPVRHGSVLAYESNEYKYFPNGIKGARLTLCHISAEGRTTFQTVPGRWVERTAGFTLLGTEFGLYLAARFLNDAGEAQPVDVGTYRAGQWSFQSTVASAAWPLPAPLKCLALQSAGAVTLRAFQ